jgi:hypothetical protein
VTEPSGTTPSPISLLTTITFARAAQRVLEPVDLHRVLRIVERFAVGGAQQVREPQRQAVDEQARVRIVEPRKRAGEVDGGIGETPVGRPARAMVRDALREFGIGGGRGRDVGDGEAAVGGEPLGMCALARARAAEDEGEVVRNHRVIVTARAWRRGG